MNDVFSPSNPYDPYTPTTESHRFFGREPFFTWLTQQLEQPAQGLILQGTTRMGKSSVLYEASNGRLPENIFPIFIPCKKLSLDSEATFILSWMDLAKETLTKHSLTLPSAEQNTFIANPYTALTKYFIQPIQEQIGHKKIFFLCDNIDYISQAIQRGLLPSDTLQRLQKELYTHNTYALFSQDSQKPAAPHLNKLASYTLEPLSQEASMRLVRQPVSYTIVKDVAEYIYEMTNGHPQDLQLVCAHLYERQRAYDLKQITIADVILVKSFALERNELYAETTARLPEYIIEPNEALVQTVRRAQWRNSLSALSWVGFVLLIGLLLSTGGILLSATPFGQGLLTSAGVITPTPRPDEQATATAIAIANFTSTPTNTPTQTPTPTNTPTQTPTSTPTNTPTQTPTPTNTPTQTPTPTLAPRTTIIREIDNMPIVYIPGGSFLMGARDDDISAGEDERPQHEIVLDPYYMDKYEVSVGQYATFLNEIGGGYIANCFRFDCVWPNSRAGYTSYLIDEEQSDGSVLFYAQEGFENYPVNHVTWYGARAYCEYVNGRLPTEAEWEYAARGNDNRLYPWGNIAPDELRAVFGSSDYSNLKPVDALPDGASAFDIYGMAGSMWEWTADWYDPLYYQESPTLNPTGPEGTERVKRGGSWPNNNQAERIRSTNRSADAPTFVSSVNGFRCVQQGE